MNTQEILENLNYVCRFFPKRSFLLLLNRYPEEHPVRRWRVRPCDKPLPKEVARLVLAKQYSIAQAAKAVNRDPSHVRTLLHSYCCSANEGLYLENGAWIGHRSLEYLRANAPRFLCPQPSNVEQKLRELLDE